ncbi:MAG TPA: hypothetical protein DCL73_11405, partial [Treponema sp.]|nr:hypothetical protein [Treponema sp.]
MRREGEMVEGNMAEESDSKLVIAIRRDLHMTRGKEIAQACHAVVGALLAL